MREGQLITPSWLSELCCLSTVNYTHMSHHINVWYILCSRSTQVRYRPQKGIRDVFWQFYFVIPWVCQDSPMGCCKTHTHTVFFSFALVCPLRFLAGLVALKAFPLQAWSGPEGSRNLRFPVFLTTAQNGGKVSLTHRPHLPRGNTPGTHFC
jgi:hypothetical protein